MSIIGVTLAPLAGRAGAAWTPTVIDPASASASANAAGARRRPRRGDLLPYSFMVIPKASRRPTGISVKRTAGQNTSTVRVRCGTGQRFLFCPKRVRPAQSGRGFDDQLVVKAG